MEELTAIGIESGIGSMLIGAKQEGFKVVGNVESRRQFHTGTFQYNFGWAFMEYDLKKVITKIPKIDLLMSHPSCGKFSSMGWANSNGKQDISEEHGSFELVISSINLIGPRFFLVDNLPRALEASPLNWWASKLPDYKLNVELVHNYGYGNVQLKRDRVFIMGWKKEEDFVFIPNEQTHQMTVQHVLHDLVDKEYPWMNHTFFPEKMSAPNMSPLNIAQVREFWKGEPEGKNPKYLRDEFDDIFYIKDVDKKSYDPDELKTRIGTKKVRWLKHGQTITSGLNLYHSLRGDPLTCRERARLMGFPDDFLFVWKNQKDEFKQKPMGCQTGQAVPVGFPHHFSRLVKAHSSNEPIECTKRRYKGDLLVEKSKKEYCKKHGFTSKDCEFCAYQYNCGVR